MTRPWPARWLLNDAYSAVALHQPSSSYGINAMPLGAHRKDTMGVNKGFFELASALASTAVSMMNPFNWSQDGALRDWVRNSRLDGFGKVMAAADKANPEHQAILGRMRSAAKPAMANVQKLMAAAPGASR